VRALFTLNVSDTQTGLKLFRREVLEICLPHVTSNGFAFDLELLVLANDAGFNIVEGPVQLEFNFSTTTGAHAVIDMLRELLRLERSRVRQRHNHTWVTRQAHQCDGISHEPVVVDVGDVHLDETMTRAAGISPTSNPPLDAVIRDGRRPV
jgi:hypothetical protein